MQLLVCEEGTVVVVEPVSLDFGVADEKVVHHGVPQQLKALVVLRPLVLPVAGVGEGLCKVSRGLLTGDVAGCAGRSPLGSLLPSAGCACLSTVPLSSDFL